MPDLADATLAAVDRLAGELDEAITRWRDRLDRLEVERDEAHGTVAALLLLRGALHAPTADASPAVTTPTAATVVPPAPRPKGGRHVKGQGVDRLVAAVREHGPLTRGRLVELTGVSGPVVTKNITRALQARALVVSGTAPRIPGQNGATGRLYALPHDTGRDERAETQPADQHAERPTPQAEPELIPGPADPPVNEAAATPSPDPASEPPRPQPKRARKLTDEERRLADLKHDVRALVAQAATTPRAVAAALLRNHGEVRQIMLDDATRGRMHRLPDGRYETAAGSRSAIEQGAHASFGTTARKQEEHDA